MSMQTRVPVRVPGGVPAGGQFAASAKAEADVALNDPWGAVGHGTTPADPWAVPRSPFRDLAPGLSEEQDAEFRDLDEPVAALRADDMGAADKRRYLLLATGIDAAIAKGATGWLPACPVHASSTTLASGGAPSGAEQWGADADCTACTENGIPLAVTARLTIPARLGPEATLQVRDRAARAAATQRRNLAEGALSEVKRAFAVSEDEADYLDGDAHEALVAFDAAFDQALFTYGQDRDAAALADTLDGIAVNEAARFVTRARTQDPDDCEAIDWLRTAADRFRGV